MSKYLISDLTVSTSSGGIKHFVHAAI